MERALVLYQRKRVFKQFGAKKRAKCVVILERPRSVSHGQIVAENSTATRLPKLLLPAVQRKAESATFQSHSKSETQRYYDFMEMPTKNGNPVSILSFCR